MYTWLMLCLREGEAKQLVELAFGRRNNIIPSEKMNGKERLWDVYTVDQIKKLETRIVIDAVQA